MAPTVVAPIYCCPVPGRQLAEVMRIAGERDKLDGLLR
jgi:hypothetical protein